MTTTGEGHAIIVRDYEAADLEAVALLWLESWADTGLSVPSDPTLGEYRERLIVEDWTVRVAEIDGEVLAFMAFDPDSDWLRQLFVAPAAKRSGLGTRPRRGCQAANARRLLVADRLR